MALSILFLNVLVNLVYIVLLLVYKRVVLTEIKEKELNFLIYLNICNLLGSSIPFIFGAGQQVVLMNLFFTVAIIFKFHVIKLVFGIEFKNKIVTYGPGVLYMLINAIFYYVYDNYTVRSFAFSLMLIFYFSFIIYFSIQNNPDKNLRNFVVIVFSILIFASLGRIVLTLFTNNIQNIFSTDVYNNLQLSFYLIGEITFTPLYFFIKYKKTLTILKAQEQELIELNHHKDKIFSIIGHDLRNPFNQISGYSNLILESGDISNPKIKGFVQSIRNSANSSYKMMENLLEWSRLNSNMVSTTLSKIDISSLVGDLNLNCAPMAEAKGISLRYSFAPNLYISANETMMNSILSNLVTNAIKFSPVNSLVEISAYQEGKFVIFKIQDQGVGIHPDNLAKLFTSTFNKSTAGTLNESGVGLGLINSQSLVKLQGGDIWAESVVGAGSSFYFKIPTWE